MDDLIGALIGVLVCLVLPVGGLAGIVFLLTRRGDGAADGARVDRIEHELGAARQALESLRREHHALKAAHDALAARVHGVAEAVGPRPVAAMRVDTTAIEAKAVEASREEAVLPTPSARAVAAAPVERVLSTAAPSSASPAAPIETSTSTRTTDPSAPSATEVPAASSAPTTETTAPAPTASTASTESRASTESAAAAASYAAALATVASRAERRAAASTDGASPPPPPPAEPTAPPPEGGGLEQWIGVRGAAALGAFVLVIAGLYFFQYSIEHGLIGPELRVALGALVGLGCIGAAETVLRTRAPALAPWLAGAGIAILYGSSWALGARYGLAPLWVSGLLMVLTTAAATALAVRRKAFAIAVLGLLGGFVTPLALSTGEDHPIPLFGYLLVLDAAILYVSHRRGWPGLGFLALCATAIYQLGWLALNMQPSTMAIGAAVVVAFSALFALVPTPKTEGETPLPVLTRAGASLLPFVFVLTFAFRDDALGHGWMTVGLTTLASVAAVVVARRFQHAWLVPVAALATVSLLAVWLVRWPLDDVHVAFALALVLVPALVFHVNAELDRHAQADSLGAAGLTALAPMGLLAIAMLSRPSPATLPLLGGLVVLLALNVRASSLVARPAFLFVAPLVFAFAFLGLDVAGAHVDGIPSPSFLLALGVLPAVALSVGALFARPEARPPLDIGVVIAACLALGGLALRADAATTDAWSFAISATVVLVVGLLATARSAPPVLTLALVLAGAFAETVWAFVLPHEGQPDLRLATLAFAVLLFSAWPLFSRRTGADPSGWRGAAIAGPAFFLGLRRGWIGELGLDYLGLLPVILAVLVLAVAFAARHRTRTDPATQRVATVWLAAVAAGFVTLAIPLQLRNEWLTIGWALEGCALLLLDARLRHAGLRWLALGLFAAVLVRLCLNPYVLQYYVRGEWRILNWLTYTYLVPAVALVAGSFVLSRHEVASREPAEKSVLGPLADRPILAGVLFGGAVAVVFAWLNLTIFDWYASGPALSIPSDRMPARDLTISIVWAVYALVLLALGMARESTALRLTSLLLILVTCGKVFLYDLSNLEDLYRVAALVGLALSLIVISLFYQRFVFRRTTTAPAARGGGPS